MRQAFTLPRPRRLTEEEIRFPVHRFLSNTSGHGLGRITRTRSTGTRTFWGLLWMACLAITIVQFLILFDKFHNQKPSTLVETRVHSRAVMLGLILMATIE